MTIASLRLLLLAGTVAGAGTALAQTSTTHHSTTAAHHTTATHPAAHSECVTVPEFSSKIPAVPAGTPCAKALITIAQNITFSPLIGPDLRNMFPNPNMSFSLVYQDIHIGTGELARPHMYYTVKYTGYLTDGTKFDSSYDHPELTQGLSFPYGGHRVIPGWDMGFEGMHLGGKRRLFIPYQLAYGERGNPKIPPKSELIFDMELVSQSETNPNPPPAPPTRPTPPGMPGAGPGAGSGAAPGSTPGAAPGTPGNSAAPPAGAPPTAPPAPHAGQPQAAPATTPQTQH
jgi:peptidylprolyl isomerase